MKKRTEEEILSLTLRFETQQIEEIYGEETISLYETIIEYSLVGDEQPKWKNNDHGVYCHDFTDASITEEEFNKKLFEPVQKLIAERNQKREQRLWNLNERLLLDRKYERKN